MHKIVIFAKAKKKKKRINAGVFTRHRAGLIGVQDNETAVM